MFTSSLFVEAHKSSESALSISIIQAKVDFMNRIRLLHQNRFEKWTVDLTQ